MTDAAPDDGGLQVNVAEVAVLLETASDCTADGPTAETSAGLSIKIVDVNVIPEKQFTTPDLKMCCPSPSVKSFE